MTPRLNAKGDQEQGKCDKGRGWFRAPYSTSNSIDITNVLCFTLLFVSVGKPSLSCRNERERRTNRESYIYIYKHTENIAAFSLSEKEKVTKKNQVQVLVLTQVGEWFLFSVRVSSLSLSLSVLFSFPLEERYKGNYEGRGL